jgi:predicted enzyme related to lactoylglutathione lyase
VSPTLQQIDIGFVSASDALVSFYEEVFGTERLEPRVFPFATVHRLAFGPVTLKVMVPSDPPASPPAATQFWDVGGLRYVTTWVDDLDAVAGSWRAAGGTIAMEPTEIRPGVRTALLRDPDGNTVEAMEQREA